MTNLTSKITSDFVRSPFMTHAVGFDRLIRDLTGPRYTEAKYPPHNLAKIVSDSDREEYEITLAVAGFSQDNINIVQEKDQLIVESVDSKESEVQEDVEYLHQGIAQRHFRRQFRLAENVEVSGATLRDGLLRIRLVKIVPEEDQARRIPINP